MVVRFELDEQLTPKAFANFSPGLERSDNPGNSSRRSLKTLKGFANCRTLSGLKISYFKTQGCRCAPTLG